MELTDPLINERPPTPEQRQKPWMDRGRFEYPEDVYDEVERVPEYAAVVWDRGPAGDFGTFVPPTSGLLHQHN